MDEIIVKRTEEIFLDIGRKLCNIIGWRDSIGHLYVLLYMENKPLSLDELAEKTNLSKTTVWGIIQQLLRLGAVKKVWLTENRKDYYAAERDFDLILSRGIVPLLKTKVNFLSSYLDHARKELDAIKKDAKNTDNNNFDYYERILAEIVEQRNKLESFLNLLGELK